MKYLGVRHVDGKGHVLAQLELRGEFFERSHPRLVASVADAARERQRDAISVFRMRLQQRGQRPQLQRVVLLRAKLRHRHEMRARPRRPDLRRQRPQKLLT